jgi:7,8-dihydropterin-6-yl-methyl-4-(beta-D-ribofuranosyl)aminobenzene 5'-phosphate synthase
MKITVLNDNAPGRNCLAEFGLSYLIEADKTILFDTGSTDVFIENANRLAISLDNIEAIVLSHGHWDHGNGLNYIGGHKLITHPFAFKKRYNKKDQRYIGLNQSLSEVQERFMVTLSEKPVHISREIIYLGEIPRINEFEAKTTYFYDEKGDDDFVLDDSALAVISPNGLVVISGCAHAGICNTIEYARKVTGVNRVYAVFGGFHLRSDNEQNQLTVEFFKKLEITKIYPCHCTALPALAKFYEVFKIHQVLTGDHFYF